MNNVIVRNSTKFGIVLEDNAANVTHSNVTFANNSGGNVKLPNGTISATLP
jgi:hypothetical protein